MRAVVGSALPRFGDHGRQSSDRGDPGRHATSQKQRQSMTALRSILRQCFSSQGFVLLLQKTPDGTRECQPDRRVAARFFLRRARARSRERG